MWCNWFNRWSTSHLILPHTLVCLCENSWTGSILGPEVCHVFSVERIILFGLKGNPTSQTHVMTHCQLTFIKTHIRAIWNDNFRRSEEFNFFASVSLYIILTERIFFSHTYVPNARWALWRREESDDGIWSSYYESEPLFKDRPIELS